MLKKRKLEREDGLHKLGKSRRGSPPTPYHFLNLMTAGTGFQPHGPANPRHKCLEAPVCFAGFACLLTRSVSQMEKSTSLSTRTSKTWNRTATILRKSPGSRIGRGKTARRRTLPETRIPSCERQPSGIEA
jgi:hypothetical protein